MKQPLSYHIGRLGKNIQLKYRLKRRTIEVVSIIKQFNNINRILDIGTADGLMLSEIRSEFSSMQCFGIDISHELLKTNTDNKLRLFQADALNMPFKDGTFDMVIAIAVIEHLSRPLYFLRESFRLLNRNGLIIITTPFPFFIFLASTFNLFNDEEHKELFYLKYLNDILVNSGFEVIKKYKFMISPIGFPFELKIEQFLRRNKLDFFLINQLIIARKK